MARTLDHDDYDALAHLAPGGGKLIGVLEEGNGNLMATERRHAKIANHDGH
jgi:hypothetical protein